MRRSGIGYRVWGMGVRVSGIVIAILALLAFSVYAEEVSSKALIERAKELDGQSVTYKGEVVTAILNRGEYSWVNLNDGDNAIGIWCRSPQLEGVKFIGGYKNKGDILEVRGVFNRACPLHRGELDIHADAITILAKGSHVKEQLSQRKSILTAVIFLITLYIIFRFRKRL